MLAVTHTVIVRTARARTDREMSLFGTKPPAPGTTVTAAMAVKCRPQIARVKRPIAADRRLSVGFFEATSRAGTAKPAPMMMEAAT